MKTVQQNIIEAEKQPSVGHAEPRKTFVLIQYFPCSKHAMRACKRSAKGLRGFKQDVLNQTPHRPLAGSLRSSAWIPRAMPLSANEILLVD